MCSSDLFGLETIKDLYMHDADFKQVVQNCKDDRTWNKFVLSDGFVFRANKLCVPASSVRFLLLQEEHGGGLMGHFGVKKTEDVLAGMLSILLLAALLARKLSHDLILMVYMCLYLYLVFRGRIYPWTLFWVYREQRRGEIAYLLLWTDLKNGTLYSMS